MAEGLVTDLIKQVISIAAREVEQELRLVVGVDKEVRKLEGNLQTVHLVLSDAEKRQVTDKAVKLWLKKLEDVSYEMDDVLDEWNTAMIKLEIEKVEEENTEKAHVVKKKVCSFIPFPSCCFHHVDKLFLRHDIAHKIKEVNEKLDEVVRERKRYGFELNKGPSHEVAERPKTTSFVDVSEICGRDNVKVDLVNILLGKGSEEERSPICHLLSGVAKAIIQEIGGIHFTCDDITELETLLRHIQELIQKKKFFLVLDDVWTEDHKKWEPFSKAFKQLESSQNSRILVTTRKIRVAKIMGSTSTRMINLEVLSEENCWLVFSKIVFSDKDPKQCEQLEDLGKQIAKKCKGLPLAAKTLGSLLRFMQSREQWNNVLDSNLWELEDVENVVEKDLFAPLLLSYNDLPSPLKRCFSFCAIFPKDYKFYLDDLVFMWMAQGYIDSKENMEIIGREYFENLAIRSFFQDFEIDHYDGSLEIRGLGNVIDVCEAKNAQLKKKIHLRYLKLYFTREIAERMENDASVLNAIEPPPNLEYLRIQLYRGTTMSFNWMMSLTKLKMLELQSLEKLEHLPPLGKLPFLERLDIWLAISLEKVGVEFLGIESKHKKDDKIKIFPNLKSLHFEYLEEWKEWIGIRGMREEEEDSSITIMPCLQKLSIWNCPKLKSLPDFLCTTPLKELQINCSPLLRKRYQREEVGQREGEDWPKISHIPNIRIDY
uniref:NB-ARC domain-containing protein n=1 Tax=Fagus sylvatica TaxID=28930 RepID=A0A2N9GG21_FAGSY